ncbi:MAG: hypothetical protein LBJ01_01845, partial [Tannerella sp.]|nr:hypothetical protein [Tannerella sp.]
CPARNKAVPTTFRPWPGRVIMRRVVFYQHSVPGRDGLTGGYSVCGRQTVFSSGHDRGNI